MSNQSSTIVQRLWKTCNVLRDERWLVSRRAVPCPSLRSGTFGGDDMLRCALVGRL
ncbi:MAG TPA: hypothetical protein VII97_12350 [Anaerolineales bacterium]